MFPDFPQFGKLPTYDFVIELKAPTARVRQFMEEILDSDYIDFNKVIPEVKRSCEGEQRQWRLTHWGSAALPKIKDIRLTNGKLIISANCLINFPETALRALLKAYNITTSRGICLAEDKSEAMMLSSDDDEPLKTQYMTRLQMREAGILKLL